LIEDAKMRVNGIFPGQGSEYPGMHEPLEGLESAAHIFSRINDAAGADVLSTLDAPLNAQLAVFGVSACYWSELEGRYDFRALAGHSLGFYSALYATGSLGLDDCIDIIARAYDAMAEICSGGRWAMAAIIGLGLEDCRRICREAGDVFVSNSNSASQMVISGDREAVDRALLLSQAGGALDTVDLGIPFPLHSPLMEGVRGMLYPAVRKMRIFEPRLPVLDHTGGGFLDSRGIAEVLAGQLQKPVLWRDAVVTLGRGTFIEVGPSNVLSRLVRWIDREARVMSSDDVLAAAGDKECVER